MVKLVEEDVKGENVHVNGHFKFVLQRSEKRNIAIVEAKQNGMQQGMVQNVTGLEALSDVEMLTAAYYTIVTNYIDWIFLIRGDDKIQMHQCSLEVTNAVPAKTSLKAIAETIYATEKSGAEKMENAANIIAND